MPIRRPVNGSNAGRSGASAADLAPSEWAKHIAKDGSPWRICRGDGPGPPRAQYAGFLYFHPFVRSFLFPGSDAEASWTPVVLERTDVSKVEIELDPPRGEQPSATKSFILGVDQVQLWLFFGGVALLVVEVSFTDASPALTLSQVQALLDSFRRTYKPYYERDPDQPNRDNAGHCPRKVTWIDNADNKITDGAESDYENWKASKNKVLEARRAPLSRHWQWILCPMRYRAEFEGRSEPTPEAVEQLSFEQFGDDRIPCMAFLGADQVTDLTRGDFIRLCECDEPGASSTLPCSTAFLNGFEREHCYDRYWDPMTPHHDWMCTRYLASPHSFLVIGSAKYSFFMDDENGILAHFRHHYFKLFFAAQLQKASLIAFAWRLADLATELPAAPDGPITSFRKRLETLQREFAIFISRFWFDEVSPQVQGRELYAMISRQMGLEALYAEVKDEMRFVGEAVSGIEQHQQTEKSVRLATLGTWVLPVALITSFLGMNVLVQSVRDRFEGWVKSMLGYEVREILVDIGVFLVVAVPTTVLWVLLIWYSRARKGSGK